MKQATVPARRIRRRPEEIAALIEEYRASGLTQAAYAREKGVSLSTLSVWLRRARVGDADGGSGRPRLVAVRLAERGGVGERGATVGFELQLPRGVRLSIPTDFDELALRRLLPLLCETC